MLASSCSKCKCKRRFSGAIRHASFSVSRHSWMKRLRISYGDAFLVIDEFWNWQLIKPLCGIEKIQATRFPCYKMREIVVVYLHGPARTLRFESSNGGLQMYVKRGGLCESNREILKQ
jgi:hypothetical protein